MRVGAFSKWAVRDIGFLNVIEESKRSCCCLEWQSTSAGPSEPTHAQGEPAAQGNRVMCCVLYAKHSFVLAPLPSAAYKQPCPVSVHGRRSVTQSAQLICNTK